MAVLAFTAVGAALGGSLLPAGISLFGATLSGAAIGGAIGGLTGSALDQTLLAPTVKTSGPRLQDVQITTSVEGAPVLRVYGRMRVGGQVIWATRFRETTDAESHGGKGGGGAEVTTYSYSASFAVGLCEGPIDGIGRIWADGEILEADGFEIRLHKGGEGQEPDPKIVAVEGEEFAPAYRGLAYLVFEELPLERFGNRVPQVTVEVIRRPGGDAPALEDLLTGVTLIPGASEFAYSTEVVEREVGFGAWEPVNAHVADGRADILASLDELETVAPNVAYVSLIVAWHGTDLRVGHCEIRPRVETLEARNRPYDWAVAGVTRDEYELVSRIGGSPAVGGAPSDRSVFEAIREMNARGLKVMVTPFVMMDVPAGNGLPDPNGGAEQAAYPWRGRITAIPAPGRPGSPDGTAPIAADVAAFFGTAAPNDFGWDSDNLTVEYDGPDAFSYRRFVLHMATIAQAAGGVDAFLIGSEMVGLTTLRDAPGSYPAVARLKTLAADMRAILGPGIRIGYAADWSEFPPHRPADGSNDVAFHLDPLWADGNIDFIGLDNYTPLADWRDGANHLDLAAGFKGPRDLDYLDANIEGGEGFDWYYASPGDRAAQARTPVVDTAHGEHWIFRSKDFRSWWENPHHNRPGGVRSAAPTAWVPQSKPIVFCEIGCPAIDKGSNQPNVFVDPKSSESFTPFFSNGRRDDLAQRACLVAQLTHWAPGAGHNPVSTLTGDRMIDRDRIHVWTWDARPPAAFPLRSDVWADSENWRLGHWLTGRLGFAALRDVVADIAGGLGVSLDLDDLEGLVRGYMLDRIMSPRDAIEPLIDAHGAEALARGGEVRIANRKSAPVAELTPDDLADLGEKKPAFRLTRAQASEVPETLKLRHVDPDADFRQGAVEARRLAGEGRAVSEASFALSLTEDEAQALADGILVEASVARERGAFALPPSRLALEPGDLVTFTAHGRKTLFRLDEIGEELVRPVKATRADPDVRDVERRAPARRPPPQKGYATEPAFEIMDLPLIDGAAPHAPRLAAYSKPFAPVAVFRSDDGETFELDQVLRRAAVIGRLTAPLGFHASGRFDRANVLEAEIGPDKTLESRGDKAVLGGANRAAVRGLGGAWEVLQFRDAELTGPGRWRLTRLLRGQFGTEDAIGAPTPEGAAFVLIDGRTPVSTVAEGLRGVELAWRAGPASRPRNDPTYTARLASVGARGLTPLAPVQLDARRDPATGDVALRWIRRTRIGGDDFDARDVRLGEEREAYEVEVFSGGGVARVIAADEPFAIYAEADQIADFGALPATLEIAVRQLSAVVGPGLPARAAFEL